jgi:hypothetical protein
LSGADKSYLSAVTNKDASHKDSSPVTYSTVTSVAKGSATGLDTKVQDKAAVDRSTVVVPQAAAIMKLGLVGALGNVTIRSDKGIAGTTTAAHRDPLVRRKVTPHRKVQPYCQVVEAQEQLLPPCIV